MRGNEVRRGADTAPATTHRLGGLVPAHRRDKVERRCQRLCRTALRHRRRMRMRGDMGVRSANVATSRYLLTVHRRDGLVPAHRRNGPAAVHCRVGPLPARQQHDLVLEEEEEEEEEERR